MLTKFASASVIDVVQVPVGANARTVRKAAHRVGFKYDPRPGYLYIRSRAISSRTNDNFDTFPAEEIKLSYLSFKGKPVFVNHHNDNHRRARGVVIDAALHEDTNPDGSPDTWCEVLMEVDAVRFPKLAKAILAGHIDRTSMGTDVAHSICSVCANKATTPLEYCQHIPRMKGQRVYKTTASGSKVGVLVHEKCYGLKFFENSLLVEEPADPTAYFLGVEDYSKTAAQDTKTLTPRWDDSANANQRAPGIKQWDTQYSPSKPLEDTMNEQMEHEENDSLALTPGEHHLAPFSQEHVQMHSLNSIHAFFRKAELSPISDCKSCGAKKGTHCEIDCGGTRLYKNAALDPLDDAHRRSFQNGHDMSPWEESSDGGHQSWCNKCGGDAKVGENEGRTYTVGPAPHHPCKVEGRDAAIEGATHHAQLWLDNTQEDSNNVHAIVNNSRHPVETSHLLHKYIHSLPESHGLKQQFKNEGWTADDVDTDSWAKDLHAERDLNPGDVHGESDRDYAQLSGQAKKTAGGVGGSGNTVAPSDVDTLRDEECPVCAEKNSYDGNECEVCGFVQPPKMFQDPNLDLAKQYDLRKDIVGNDPTDPVNSDPQGQNQVPQQGTDDPNAVDAQGMPNEVPGSGVPGTDQIDPNAPMPGAIPGQPMPNQQLVPGAPQQASPMLPGQPGQPGQPMPGGAIAPASPTLIDQDGNMLPSDAQGVVPPKGLPYEGPEGTGTDSPILTGPNGLPVAPGTVDNDAREMGKTDVSVNGTEPGLPLLDGTLPDVKMQWGTGDSIEPAAAPPGVQGDTMPTTDIYGQPLGPDGPISPEEVQQYQQMQQGGGPMVEPQDGNVPGEALTSGGDAGGGTGDEFGASMPNVAPDGQPFDQAQAGDSSIMLVCNFCGEEFESTPPMSVTTDQPGQTADGAVLGDVCPICGQGILEAETTDPAEQDGNAAGAGAGNNAGGGGDLMDNSRETTPFGKNKLSVKADTWYRLEGSVLTREAGAPYKNKQRPITQQFIHACQSCQKPVTQGHTRKVGNEKWCVECARSVGL